MRTGYSIENENFGGIVNMQTSKKKERKKKKPPTHSSGVCVASRCSPVFNFPLISQLRLLIILSLCWSLEEDSFHFVFLQAASSFETLSPRVLISSHSSHSGPRLSDKRPECLVLQMVCPWGWDWRGLGSSWLPRSQAQVGIYSRKRMLSFRSRTKDASGQLATHS